MTDTDPLAPPPGSPAPPETRMSSETAQPGDIVAAPKAPKKGRIPKGQQAVVVPVTPWYKTEIVIALAGLIWAGGDAAVNALVPVLMSGSGPIDMTEIKRAFTRAFLLGVASAFVAWRRKSANDVVR